MDDPIIAVQGLAKRYGDVEALVGVTFRIGPGEIVALVGSNGAGKSTLFEILAGLRRASSGSAALFGHEAAGLPAGLKAEMVFVPQEGAVPPWASAADIAGLYRGLYPRFDEAAMRRLFDGWGLAPAARFREFSRGEQRLAALAIAVGIAPRLLCLDEPFADLDPVMRHEVIAALRALHERTGITLLYSTHILSEVARLARRVIILRAGEIAVDRVIGGAGDDAVEALFMRHYGLAEAR